MLVLEELRKRRRGQVVRLEVDRQMPREVRQPATAAVTSGPRLVNPQAISWLCPITTPGSPSALPAPVRP